MFWFCMYCFVRLVLHIFANIVILSHFAYSVHFGYSTNSTFAVYLHIWHFGKFCIFSNICIKVILSILVSKGLFIQFSTRS